MIQVQVNEGVLEGEEVQNEYGGKFYSFKGIPYAEPPVGDLRFKSPKPPKPWNGVRSAKEFAPKSVQPRRLPGQPFEGSEDCLYLNVYTPEIKPRNLLPVMFWIHGGAFISGSGNDDMYGPEFLVRHGVILVTINYRLGIFGYLCLHTEDIPGNAGMKDQVAALRWVKENIKSFGGDPGNVTIFGESAGGLSCSFHLVSPMSKGLFKRAITQSGTSACWASNLLEPRERAKATVKEMGCDLRDDKEIETFLKTQPIQSFINKKITLTFAEDNKEGPFYIFGVVQEMKFGNVERFWDDDIYDALRNGALHDGVDIISGYTEDEGALYFFDNDFDKILAEANKFPEFFVPHPLAINLPLTKQLEIGRKFKAFYFKGEEVSKETVKELLRYFNFDMFVYSSILWQKLCANGRKNRNYLYKFTCKSNRNVFSTLFQVNNLVKDKNSTVAHGDDLPYIFPCKIFSQHVDVNSETFKMIDNVTKLWTNFSKFGDPTPGDSLGVTWAPYTLETEEYLNIGANLIPEKKPDGVEMKFWEDIFREYYPKLVL